MKKYNIAPKRRWYLGNQYPGVYFTGIEAICMHLLLKNFNEREIGKTLDFSLYTVNFFIFRIQAKLNCAREDIIKAVKNSDFEKTYKVPSGL